jgi:hypothetical protein
MLKLIGLHALQVQIMDQVHDSIVATDLNGVIASWNRGAEHLHGYSADEAIGRHISLICPSAADSRLNAERLDRLLECGFEERNGLVRNKSGRLHSIHARLSLVRDAANVPIGILSIEIDTTELQQARAEVQERERQLRTILDAIPLLVAHVDSQMRFKFANRAYDALTDGTPNDLVGRSVQELGGVNFASMRPDIEAALKGIAVTSESEFIFANGERRSMLIQRIPDIAEGGVAQGYFVVATDITETKRDETARLEREHRLRESLISEVHHRVKNSLQGVVGLLRSQAAKYPDLADLLAPAISQVLSISVGFGLSSTRGERGVVLCDMVREIGRNLEQITGASIATAVDQAILDQPIVLDRAHAVNLGLVVNELIFNAVKHGKAAGAGPHVNVLMQRNPGGATVSISNHVDATPTQLDFASGTGLGLGLSLVRTLLPSRGCGLSFAFDADQVTTVLTLRFDALGVAALNP